MCNPESQQCEQNLIHYGEWFYITSEERGLQLYVDDRGALTTTTSGNPDCLDSCQWMLINVENEWDRGPVDSSKPFYLRNNYNLRSNLTRVDVNGTGKYVSSGSKSETFNENYVHLQGTEPGNEDQQFTAIGTDGSRLRENDKIQIYSVADFPSRLFLVEEPGIFVHLDITKHLSVNYEKVWRLKSVVDVVVHALFLVGGRIPILETIT